MSFKFEQNHFVENSSLAGIFEEVIDLFLMYFNYDTKLIDKVINLKLFCNIETILKKY